MITLLLLVRAIYITPIPFVVNHTINATPPEMLQQHPLPFTTNRTDCTFFCGGCIRHDLHILVTAPFCWRVSHSVTHKHELWIRFTLSYAMI